MLAFLLTTVFGALLLQTSTLPFGVLCRVLDLLFDDRIVRKSHSFVRAMESLTRQTVLILRDDFLSDLLRRRRMLGCAQFDLVALATINITHRQVGIQLYAWFLLLFLRLHHDQWRLMLHGTRVYCVLFGELVDFASHGW